MSACRASIATLAKRKTNGPVRVDVEGIRPRDDVGRVQYESANSTGVTDGESLREERSVGVTVKVDLVDVEMIQDRGEIVGGVARPIEVGGITQFAAASPNRGVVVPSVGLKLPAKNCL
jgi:hypothetical protein